jgi:hypothetical protein
MYPIANAVWPEELIFSMLPEIATAAMAPIGIGMNAIRLSSTDAPTRDPQPAS